MKFYDDIEVVNSCECKCDDYCSDCPNDKTGCDDDNCGDND